MTDCNVLYTSGGRDVVTVCVWVDSSVITCCSVLYATGDRDVATVHVWVDSSVVTD